MTNQEAIRILDEQRNKFMDEWIDYGGVNEAYNMAISLLKEQVRPKGSWDYGTECSICHKTIIPPKDRTVKVYFCPWCGADMRQWYGE